MQQQLPLRDIHLPESISFLWPLAPGWWLLLALLLFLILVSIWLHRLRKRNAAKRIALRKLKKLEKADAPKKLVQEISTLLRRFYITKYPRKEVASLTGEDWLAFLDNQLGEQSFTAGEGRCLIDAPYRPDVAIDVKALLKLCRLLIKKGKHK
ncbi:hypothetical protein PN36_32500 [Candidatus Thiomargarita nelsonii]|uniref:DUF4381 domain-containing protein n=1 Tax=Candidatus Thiomargarita nelsonii TaxID=1003181 RepID=A0A0A6PCB3_9GAMM|nr:hypothetical protein PN36_32500 [Candidatus Thiomargarita nelsonii]